MESARRRIAAAKRADYPAFDFDYTERDVILYALGVNCKRSDLRWVYENSPSFGVLPTFGVIPAFAFSKAISLDDILPNFNPVGVSFKLLPIVYNIIAAVVSRSLFPDRLCHTYPKLTSSTVLCSPCCYMASIIWRCWHRFPLLAS